MPNFCEIKTDIRINGRVIKEKCWPACDVMKTSATRSWTTRQFNIALKNAKKDEIVRGEWIARYGEAHGHISISGWISGVNGKPLARRGIFRD